MRTIKECIDELKTRRDWKSVEEVERVFDEILEIERANNLEKEKENQNV